MAHLQTKNLSQDILNAIGFSLAVVDTSGVIILTNTAWLDFARNNGLSSLDTVSEGVNYLRVCSSSSNQEHDLAWQAEQGIRQILSGMMSRFEMEYPCHGPDQERWFQMQVSPLQDEEDIVGAVIAHVETTSKVQINKQLMKRRNQYLTLFNSIRDAILVADTTRRIIDCNPAFTDLFGYSLNEIKAEPTKVVYASEEDFLELGRQLKNNLDNPHFFITVNYKTKSGHVFPGQTNVFYYRDLEGTIMGFIGLIRDMSEKKQRDQARDKEMDSLQDYSAWNGSAQTALSLGMSRLHQARPDVASRLKDLMSFLLEQALEKRGFKVETNDVSRQLRQMAHEFGRFNGGPRDVVRVYVHALQEKISGIQAQKAQAYTDEGRMLLVELMGYMTAFYQARCLNPEEMPNDALTGEGHDQV